MLLPPTWPHLEGACRWVWGTVPVGGPAGDFSGFYNVGHICGLNQQRPVPALPMSQGYARE